MTPRTLLLGWHASLTDEAPAAATGVVERGAGWADLAMVEELTGHLRPAGHAPEAHGRPLRGGEASPSDHDVEVALPGRGTQAAADVDFDSGLTSCQLQPAGLTGAELFEPMACRRGRRDRRLKPALRRLAVDALDLAVGGRVEQREGRRSVASDQLRATQPTDHDLAAGAVPWEAGVRAASVRAPRRTLDVLGEVDACSVRTSAHGRTGRPAAATELASTLDRDGLDLT